MRRFDDEDLTGAEFRECDLSRARMVGVVMHDAEIDGLVTNLVVNGVEVMPYVEAELDRRHPVRLLIRSDDPEDLREAWRQLRDDWARTTERVRSMPANSEHHRVDGEWSMVETLRHLVFVHDSWFRRCVLGLTEPFTAMGLGPPSTTDEEDEEDEEDENGLDRSAQPSLEEVLAVRAAHASEIETWLAQVTPDQLAQTAPVPDDDRWPPYATGRTVRQCLGTVLNEEWAHHGFCRRDLDKLSGQGSSQGSGGNRGTVPHRSGPD
ncbi:DinB family protein [Intrasporangium sp. DVR]|uniref:DinB family protein n=1 Tax=Intrasporangium sp. DVR TaxID=3127867 RepID=UPI00313A69AA